MVCTVYIETYTALVHIWVRQWVHELALGSSHKSLVKWGGIGIQG